MEKIPNIELLNVSFKQSGTAFSIEVLPRLRTLNWKQAYIERCKLILSEHKNINIFFSGGLDSLIPALCFLELGKCDVIHTHFIMTLNGQIVNADEHNYAHEVAKKLSLKLETIEHKLEDLIINKEILKLSVEYALPHFEWAWQAYMIRHNPFQNTHFNIGCAGDINSNLKEWFFNPFWTFQERVRMHANSKGCFLLPLSSNELIYSWLLDDLRLQLSSKNSDQVVVRDAVIYHYFPEVKSRNKKYVYQQNETAEKIINKFNEKHIYHKIDEHIIRIPISQIFGSDEAKKPFIFQTDTNYKSEL